MGQPYRDEEGRCPYDMLLREGQVHCELAVVDPSNQCAPAHLLHGVMLGTSWLRTMCWP